MGISGLAAAGRAGKPEASEAGALPEARGNLVDVGTVTCADAEDEGAVE